MLEITLPLWYIVCLYYLHTQHAKIGPTNIFYNQIYVEDYAHLYVLALQVNESQLGVNGVLLPIPCGTEGGSRNTDKRGPSCVGRNYWLLNTVIIFAVASENQD